MAGPLPHPQGRVRNSQPPGTSVYETDCQPLHLPIPPFPTHKLRRGLEL